MGLYQSRKMKFTFSSLPSNTVAREFSVLLVLERVCIMCSISLQICMSRTLELINLNHRSSDSLLLAIVVMTQRLILNCISNDQRNQQHLSRCRKIANPVDVSFETKKASAQTSVPTQSNKQESQLKVTNKSVLVAIRIYNGRQSTLALLASSSDHNSSAQHQFPRLLHQHVIPRANQDAAQGYSRVSCILARYTNIVLTSFTAFKKAAITLILPSPVVPMSTESTRPLSVLSLNFFVLPAAPVLIPKATSRRARPELWTSLLATPKTVSRKSTGTWMPKIPRLSNS